MTWQPVFRILCIWFGRSGLAGLTTWTPVRSGLASAEREFDNRSMREVEAIAALEGQWQPVALYHVARGLRWQVREALDGWTHAGWPGRTYRNRWPRSGTGCGSSARCRGGRTNSGSSLMIVTSYGNRDHWWIRPES
jgi:hypothetical protein